MVVSPNQLKELRKALVDKLEKMVDEKLILHKTHDSIIVSDLLLKVNSDLYLRIAEDLESRYRLGGWKNVSITIARQGAWGCEDYVILRYPIEE
jgi:hypothetical protein